MKRLIAVTTGIGVLAVLHGCAAMPMRRTNEKGELITVEKQLNVAPFLRFEDVPIPAGFISLKDQSFVFQDASTRVGLLRFSGRAHANQAVSFFKSQMAIYNWDLQNIVEHGIITMNFIKGDENCMITIEPLTTKTILNIVIAPSRGTVSTGFGLRKEKF